MRTTTTLLGGVILALMSGLAHGQGLSDVTLARGLGGQYSPNPAGADVRMMSGGVAVFDFNNDGLEDIFWPAGSLQASRLYRNDGGNAGFTDVGFAAGLDVLAPITMPSFADIDGDGDFDMFMTTYEDYSYDGEPFGYRNILMRNNGDETFTDVTLGSGLQASGRWGASWGDLDGDGDLDLVVVTWSPDDGTYFFENTGNLSFVERTQADIKADDIWGFSPTIVDYDGDGDQDVLTTGDYQTSRVWRNEGGWTFSTVNATIVDGLDLDDDNGMGSAIGDWDGDGLLDWFVSSIYSENPPAGWTPKTGNRLYLGVPGGTFTDGSLAAGVRDGGWGWGSQMMDVDNDSLQDIIHVNGMYLPAFPSQSFLETDTLRMFLNNGDGTMTDGAIFVGINDIDQGRGLVVFDHNDDGKLDVLVSNNDTGLTLYQNNIATPGNWAEIKLNGTGDNPFAIGSKVRIAGPGIPTQTKWITHGANFISQSPAAAWFGLDNATRFRLEVTWPDGTVTISGVTGSNQTIWVDHPRI